MKIEIEFNLSSPTLAWDCFQSRCKAEVAADLAKRGLAPATVIYRLTLKEGTLVRLEYDTMPPPTAAVLSDEFQTWVFSQGLPAEGDAMELLMSDIPTREQRVWLTDFVQRWEAAESHPDFWSA